MAKVKAIPEGHHTLTPMLTFENTAAAIDWYKQALGAKEISRSPGPDGKILHAEIEIGDSRIMMHDTMMGAKGPKGFGGSPISMWIYVEDCDALFNRAVAAGGSVSPGGMGQMADQFWGDRCGTFTDPHGYAWTIATHKEDVTPQQMEQRMKEAMAQMSQAAH